MFYQFSVPEQLHSDQGRQFEAEVMSQLCNLLHIKKTHTTPYHPQSDRLNERFNCTLLNMLSTWTDNLPTEWDQHLKKLCFAYNTSIQNTTGYTPFSLMFGREARLPVDLMFGSPNSDVNKVSYSTYTEELQLKLIEAYDYVRQNVSHQQRRQKEYYNQKFHGKAFVKGELVWLHNPVVKKDHSHKLHKPWSGQYKVCQRLSDVNYQIQDLTNYKKKVVHFERLKYCPPNIRLPQKSKETNPLQMSNTSKPP